MVKEIALLPEVPKCLTNFDPTKFRPDWKASGRRWRVDKAAKCLDEVGEALYSKGVVRMSLMAAVDDSRKVCHIVVIIDVVIVIIVVIIVASPPLTFINPQTVKVLSAAPPGTPTAVFLENHKKEMDPQQFDNMKSSSTTYCLISLLDFLYQHLEKRKTSVALSFIDFRKAFDLVDHTTIITKALKLGSPPTS